MVWYGMVEVCEGAPVAVLTTFAKFIVKIIVYDKPQICQIRSDEVGDM